MRNTAEISDSRERRAVAHEPIAAQVQKTLVEILKSVPFRTSRQSQQLLQYIVDQTLAGHVELLKERVIGAEVFGRPPDYDTNEDPIVRGRAAEVRKRLAQFYVSEGKHCPVRIEISPDPTMPRFPISPGLMQRNQSLQTSIRLTIQEKFSRSELNHQYLLLAG